MEKSRYWKLSLSILKILDFLYQAFLISSIYQIFIGNLPEILKYGELHAGMNQASGLGLVFLSLFVLAWQVSSSLVIILLGIRQKTSELMIGFRLFVLIVLLVLLLERGISLLDDPILTFAIIPSFFLITLVERIRDITRHYHLTKPS